MEIRVYYEDTDAGGIVYHSNYLNFCERARSEAFFSKGKTPLFEEGEFVVASLEAKFRSSARLGDLLNVTSELISIKATSLVLLQRVCKEDVLLFEMEVKLAFMRSGSISKLSKEGEKEIISIFS